MGISNQVDHFMIFCPFETFQGTEIAQGLSSSLLQCSSKLVYNDMNLPKNPAFYERDNIALRSKNSWLPTKEWCYTPREIDALLGTNDLQTSKIFILLSYLRKIHCDSTIILCQKKFFR